MIQSLITWYHVTERFPQPSADHTTLLFLHGDTLYAGWPIDADPGTDPLQWQWETVEPSRLRTHISWWAYHPEADLPPCSPHDSWLSCPCQACAAVRAADVPVGRRGGAGQGRPGRGGIMYQIMLAMLMYVLSGGIASAETVTELLHRLYDSETASLRMTREIQPLMVGETPPATCVAGQDLFLSRTTGAMFRCNEESDGWEEIVDGRAETPAPVPVATPHREMSLFSIILVVLVVLWVTFTMMALYTIYVWDMWFPPLDDLTRMDRMIRDLGSMREVIDGVLADSREPERRRPERWG